MKNTYNIEVTDTFAGDANYSWVKRFECKASSFRGAIHWLAKNYASGWVFDYSTGEFSRYNLKGSAICCFVSYKN